MRPLMRLLVRLRILALEHLLLRGTVLIFSAAFGLLMGWAMLDLPAPAVQLAPLVQAHIADSGASHPVTAVLLNFRGYDTLLEIAVLLLAILGVLAARGNDPSGEHHMQDTPQPVLQLMTRGLTPLMVLVAGYLLWAGAFQPGGAFQASAVLAAGVVLLYLAGLLAAPPTPGPLLRVGLTSGFVVFVVIAAAALWQGALLQYPPAWAGALILIIEASLTFSVALILAGLFLWLPNEDEEAEE